MTRPSVAELEEALARGETTWLGLSLHVRPGVLLPRPETELCARVALASLPGDAAGVAVDVCCGAGNLAVALAVLRPRLVVHALDVEPAAVELARANALRHGVDERVLVTRSDVYDALGAAHDAALELVVCNPPYISSGRLERGLPTIAASEPASAFDGGPFGIAVQTRVIRGARRLLRPGGRLVMEFGEGQERQLSALVRRAGGYAEPLLHHDAAGVPRVLEARREA